MDLHVFLFAKELTAQNCTALAAHYEDARRVSAHVVAWQETHHTAANQDGIAKMMAHIGFDTVFGKPCGQAKALRQARHGKTDHMAPAGPESAGVAISARRPQPIYPLKTGGVPEILVASSRWIEAATPLCAQDGLRQGRSSPGRTRSVRSPGSPAAKSP